MCQRFNGAEVARTCAGLFQHVNQLCDVLLQGQRGAPRQPCTISDHLGVMEEAEAEGEGPVAVREGPGGHGPPPGSQSTTTNLLASVKEQVGDQPRTVNLDTFRL